MVKSNGNGRGGNGRFTQGNGGGPGRPAKKKQLDDATLKDLLDVGDGPELFLVASVLADREEWLAKIEKSFPKAVSDRIKTLVALSDLARHEVVKRLRDG